MSEGLKQFSFDFNNPIRYSIQRIEIRLIKEDSPVYIISSSKDVFELLSSLKDCDREQCVAVYLDSKNKVIGIQTVSIGSLTASIIHPREIFKGAILLSAASVIIAHNHPSGDTKPSKDDIEITMRI